VLRVFGYVVKKFWDRSRQKLRFPNGMLLKFLLPLQLLNSIFQDSFLVSCLKYNVPSRKNADAQCNTVKIILPSFTETIKTTTITTNSLTITNTDDTSLSFRRVQECDVPELVRMYVREWGPSNRYDNPHVIQFVIPRQFFSSPISLSSLPSFSFLDVSKIFLILSDIVDYCDNFLLACCFYLGLYQRIQRPQWSSITEPDHQWWCLVSHENTENPEILGAAEFSLQPPGVKSTALAIPMELKTLFWKEGHDEDFSQNLEPYISNVIIKRERRGFGYGRILMLCLEQVSIAYGYSSLSLHVDAVASPLALSLYSRLGYLEERRPYSTADRQQIGHELILKSLRNMLHWCTILLRCDPELVFMKKYLKISTLPTKVDQFEKKEP
jgi:ribosomal protein S18 acetylase RimI-like enzyme